MGVDKDLVANDTVLFWKPRAEVGDRHGVCPHGRTKSVCLCVRDRETEKEKDRQNERGRERESKCSKILTIAFGKEVNGCPLYHYFNSFVSLRCFKRNWGKSWGTWVCLLLKS